jgi:hypothetical protein
MNDAFDKFLKQNIKKIEEECYPSGDFVNKIMFSCYRYEEKKANRILWMKRAALSLVPLALIALIVFVPGVSTFLLSIFAHINWLSALKYYLLSSSVMTISFYLILSERIVKFIKQRRQVLQSVTI